MRLAPGLPFCKERQRRDSSAWAQASRWAPSPAVCKWRPRRLRDRLLRSLGNVNQRNSRQNGRAQTTANAISSSITVQAAVMRCAG